MCHNDMVIVTISTPNDFEVKYDDHISITKEDCIASAILAKPYAKDPFFSFSILYVIFHLP